MACLVASFTVQATHSRYYEEYYPETGMGFYEESGFSNYLGNFFREGIFNEFGDFEEFCFNNRKGFYTSSGDDQVMALTKYDLSRNTRVFDIYLDYLKKDEFSDVFTPSKWVNNNIIFDKKEQVQYVVKRNNEGISFSVKYHNNDLGALGALIRFRYYIGFEYKSDPKNILNFKKLYWSNGSRREFGKECQIKTQS